MGFSISDGVVYGVWGGVVMFSLFDLIVLFGLVVGVVVGWMWDKVI